VRSIARPAECREIDRGNAAADAEDEILLTASGRYVPPCVHRAAGSAGAGGGCCRAPPEGATRLLRPGPFRNLLWRAAPDSEPLGDDEIEIEVRAAGLNFRDVMYAMGLLPDEAVEDGFCGPTLGMEVSGIVTRVGPGVADIVPADAGDRLRSGSFGNRVRTRALAVTRKPALGRSPPRHGADRVFHGLLCAA